MKLCSALLTVATVLTPLFSFAQVAKNPAEAKRNAVAAYGKLPLSFEPTGSSARFIAHSGAYTVAVGARESSVAVSDAKSKSGKGQTLRFAFANSHPLAQLNAIEPLPGVTNYYIGQDSSKWRLGVKNFAKVRAQNVYPGVDVIYYGDHRRMEFDFVIAPNASPSAIALSFSGMDRLTKDATGDLIAEVGGQAVRFGKPYAYQKVAGVTKPVEASYELASSGSVHLRVGDYDKSSELIIDPVVSYATYVGGLSDVANGIAVDASGYAYVTGETCSSSFPVSTNGSFTGSCDAYVTKFSIDGTSFVYTSLLGGAQPNPSTGFASGNGIAVDASGTAYIIGTTDFTDLPAGSLYTKTSDANLYQNGDTDAFIAILAADGSLARRAYLGGSGTDSGYGIAVDSKLNIIAVGQTCSDDFPTYNQFQSKIETCVAFITKLDTALHIPVKVNGILNTTSDPGTVPPTVYYFSDVFGGQPTAPPYVPAYTEAYGVARDPLDDIFVAGGTSSSFLVTQNHAGSGAWVLKILGSDGSYVYSTVLESTATDSTSKLDTARAIAVDTNGRAYVVGTSTGTLYTTANAYQAANAGGADAFVVRMNAAGSATDYATYLGGSGSDQGLGVAVDVNGAAYVTGSTSSPNFPTINPLVNPNLGNTPLALSGTQDAFVAKLTSGGSALILSSYLGGSDIDQGNAIAIDTKNQGDMYVAGTTHSLDLESLNLQPSLYMPPQIGNSGNGDGFVAKLDGSSLPAVTVNPTSWDFGDQTLNCSANVSSPATKLFTYTVDNSTVLLSSATVSGTGFKLSPTGALDECYYPKTVAPTTSCTITVAFAPATQGPATGALTITDNVAGSPRVINFSGNGVVPFDSFAPTSVTFPTAQTVGIQTTNPQQLVLTNTGKGTLYIGTFVWSSSEFSLATPPATPPTPAVCGASLTAGASCTILVAFTPSAAGARTGTLTIPDNTLAATHVIQLSGTGSPLVTSTITPSVNFTVPPVQALNSPTSPLPITITNNDPSQTLIVNAGSPSGDFQISNSTCSTTGVTPGGTCTVYVTFTPTAPGLRTGTLVITGNGSTMPATVNLTGTGGVIATLSSATSFAGTNLTESSAAQVLTLVNTSAFPLNIKSIASAASVPPLGTDNSGDFAVTNNCGSTVAASGSCTISVVFNPTATGTRTAAVTVISDAAASPQSVALTGPGTQPIANLSIVDPIGNQALNAAFVLPAIKLTNSASGPFAGPLNIAPNGITFSGAAASDFAQTNNCPAKVLPGDSCTLNVTFTPSVAAVRTANLVVTDDAAPITQTAALTGTGVPVNATVLPSPLAFTTSIQLGQSSTSSSITVKNTDLAFDLALGTPTPSGDFQVVTLPAPAANCGKSLSKGSTCVIGVTFTPTARGLRSGTLTLASPNELSSWVVPLTGTGGASLTVTPPSGNAPSTLNLGSSNLTEASPAQLLTLSNASTFPVNLDLTGLTLSGPSASQFAFVNNCGTIVPVASGTPAVSGTCTIGVTFTPTAAGVQTAYLTIASDSATPSVVVTLQGTGTSPVVSFSLPSAPTVPVTNLNLPTQALYTSTSASAGLITLSNTGNGPLKIGGITITGVALSDYAVSNTCPTPVPALTGSCTLSVIFTPSAVGSRLANLVITDDANSTPQTITLSGTGALVQAPTVTQTNFNTYVQVGSSSTGTITVAASDSQTLLVNQISLSGDFQVSAGGDKCTGIKVVAGTPCTIGVTFKPTLPGTRTGTLTLTGNNMPSSTVISGTAGANLTPSQPSIQFTPSLNLGLNSSPQQVTLTNNSSYALNISGVTVTGQASTEFAVLNNCGTNIPAGGNCYLSVTFQPAATGLRTATLTVANDSFNSPLSISLSGTGTAPVVNLSSPSISFGSQPLGAADTWPPITLTNTGTGPLNISGITFSGAAAGDFSQSNTCGTQVAALSGTCTISVVFTPSALYTRSAVLNINDDATPGSQTIALLGSGAQLLVPSASPTTLNFVGNQALNVQSAPLSVTVTNNDPSFALTLSKPAVTGDFQFVALSAGGCGTSLPKSSTCLIGVAFLPTVSGARTGTLTIATNAASTPLQVQLTGTGGGIVSVGPASLDLGSENVGESSALKSVTLTNSSSIPVNITGVALTGTSASQFVFTNNCGTIVPASGSCTISVFFKPTATGIQTATMTIASDSATAMAPVALQGTGTTPVVAVSTASLGFGSVPLNVASTAQQITVNNTGSGALNFSSIAISGAASSDFQMASSTTCGQQVLSMGSCVISVVFTPSALNSRIASLVLTDDAANSPQTVSLSGTGITGSGVISLSGSTLAFGSQQLNTATSAKTVTLTNSSTTSPLTISKMTIAGTNAGDFAETSNCPTATSLAAGASCQIAIAFDPSVTGSESATLTISGSASNSPATVNLTGTGTTTSSSATDFSLTAAASGVSVIEGSSATFNVAVTPLNNFIDPITFTCSGPSGSSCSVTPSPLTMDGTTVSNVKLYVSTTGGNGATAGAMKPTFGTRSIFLALLPFSIMGMLLINKRRGFLPVLLLITLCLIMGSVGCGSGSSSTSSGGLAPGSYQVVLTAQSNGTTPETHAVTLSLVVSKQ